MKRHEYRKKNKGIFARVLPLLLALVMLFGMIPGTNTAFATEGDGEEPHIGTTTAADVNIYETPNTESDVVAVITDEGTQVAVKQVVSADDAIWYSVETTDEEAGYVYSDDLEYTMSADEEIVIFNEPAEAPAEDADAAEELPEDTDTEETEAPAGEAPEETDAETPEEQDAALEPDKAPEQPVQYAQSAPLLAQNVTSALDEPITVNVTKVWEGDEGSEHLRQTPKLHLESRYKEIEWIEGNGTQYIALNTIQRPSSTQLGVEMDFQKDENAHGSGSAAHRDGYLFGYRMFGGPNHSNLSTGQSAVGYYILSGQNENTLTMTTEDLLWQPYTVYSLREGYGHIGDDIGSNVWRAKDYYYLAQTNYELGQRHTVQFNISGVGTNLDGNPIAVNHTYRNSNNLKHTEPVSGGYGINMADNPERSDNLNDSIQRRRDWQLFVFCANKPDYTSSPNWFRPSSFRLYGLKLYEGTKLAHDFVPVVEKDTNKAGLYDLIGHVFYPNAGTGEFNTGDPVPDDQSRLLYDTADSVDADWLFNGNKITDDDWQKEGTFTYTFTDVKGGKDNTYVLKEDSIEYYTSRITHIQRRGSTNYETVRDGTNQCTLATGATSYDRTITNTLPKAYLIVHKVVDVEDLNNPDQVFPFRLTIKDYNGDPVTGIDDWSIDLDYGNPDIDWDNPDIGWIDWDEVDWDDPDIDWDEFWDELYEKLAADCIWKEEGNGVYTFYLKNGTALYSSVLPAQSSYTVEELDTRGYTTKVVRVASPNYEEEALTGTSVDGTVAVGSLTELWFTNTFQRADLTVKKTTDVETDEEFEFTIELHDEDDPYKFAIVPEGLTAVEDEPGKYTFTVKGGEQLKIQSLLKGVTYKITESPKDGWKLKETPSNAEGTLNEDATVEFVNEMGKAADLIVSKTVAGNFGDMTKAFPFTLTVTDDVGDAITDLSEPDGANGWDASDKANGVYTFTLKHDESLTIELPEDAKYTISEENGDYTATYKVNDGEKTSSNNTGERTLDKDTEVAFTNTLNAQPPTGVFPDGKTWRIVLALSLVTMALLSSVALLRRRARRERGL